MEYYGLSLLVASLLTGVGCEGPTADETVKTSLEDGSVSLSFNYPNLRPSDFFFWYRQNPAEPPEFLLSHSGTGNIVMNEIPELKIEVNKTQIDLLISSAAVTDSAVYYCAVRTGSNQRKLLFAAGTSLTIETKEVIEPDYYKLEDNSTTVCLATGFTRHNGTINEPVFDKANGNQIKDASGKPTGYYSQVAFLTDGQTCGDDDEKKEVQCDASLEPDEMVNLASITIFGLRVIFMKTVAFNVLMTLRLWMSQ